MVDINRCAIETGGMKISRSFALYACLAMIFALGTLNHVALGQSPSAATTKPGVIHVYRCTTMFWASGRVLKIWGITEGKKVELMANYAPLGKTKVVEPGDYPIEIKRDEKTDSGIFREYEVELSPGKREKFSLSGTEE
ncbi:MAG TPA: hypothetical protein VGU46_10905 [Acidobacteriaceae bacterium]|nr:hypothetical protein [Acidobacteriaceae bacterium]